MDLVAFPPVCLPSPGQSFEGSDGIIAGENLTRSPYMTQPTSRQSCLIGSLVGWGLTESSFTSDGLKEVEVQPFLTFPFFWSIFSPRNLESPSKGKLWPFSF